MLPDRQYIILRISAINGITEYLTRNGAYSNSYSRNVVYADTWSKPGLAKNIMEQQIAIGDKSAYRWDVKCLRYVLENIE